VTSFINTEYKIWLRISVR